ncbi:MAG: leucine-rich repeat protein [Metamycoplasmataceae bacterium]
MKKTQKNLLLGSCLMIVGIGFPISINYYINTNNSENNQINLNNFDLENEKLDSNSNTRFQGTVLDKNAVIALGWDTRTQITLADWGQAPNVTSIGFTFTPTMDNSPFANNTSLRSIEIPDRITRISDYSFANASVLAIVNIPDSVVTIGLSVFNGTVALNGRNVSMPSTLRNNSTNRLYGFTQQQWDTISWRPVPFLGTTLSANDVFNIGWSRKEVITLEDWELYAPNVTEIGARNSTTPNAPFANNTSLRRIEIPSRVTAINQFAFTRSSITSINIPDSVTTIGNNAFATTSSLQGSNISMYDPLRQHSSTPLYGFTQEQWDTINWRPVIFQGTTLTKDDVIDIGWSSKTEITLADWEFSAPNVIGIGDENSTVDSSPFSGNTILQSIEIPSRVTIIGRNGFGSTTSLTKITFENNSSLTKISNNAFNGSGIVSINIPDSVTLIEGNAFSNTLSLQGKDTYILATLRNNSTTRLYGFTEEQWETIIWKPIIFTGTRLTRNDIINIGWRHKEIITLEDWKAVAPNVTRIGDDESTQTNSPFSGNTTLKSIDIPSRIIMIGNDAFSSSSLNTITFEENSELFTIGNNAFENSGITSINIPISTTKIAENAFSNTIFLDNILLDYKLFLLGGSLIPNFGFTEQQWDSIIWSNIPNSGMINKIIAKNLLKTSSVLTWNSISTFSGIEPEAFRDTNISSIQILSEDKSFVIGERAFINTNFLKEIELSEIYKEDEGKYGFTNEQILSIKYIPLLPLPTPAPNNNNNTYIILGSISGGVILLIGAGLLLFLKNKRRNALTTYGYENSDNIYFDENQGYIDENQGYYDENQEYFDENQEYFDENQEYYDENQEYFDENQGYYDENEEF